MPEVEYVHVKVIHQFMVDVFEALGTPPGDARICAEVLIASDLRGIESHGVGRLKYYYDRIQAGVQFTKTEMEIVKETETSAVVDGHHGMGHAIAYRSMRLAMDKARQYGLGAVAVRNGTHFGIAGYYPLMAVEEGMIVSRCWAPTLSPLPHRRIWNSPSVSMGRRLSASEARSKWRPAPEGQCQKAGSLMQKATQPQTRPGYWKTWARPRRPSCHWVGTARRLQGV